jgi:hypothetical protein
MNTTTIGIETIHPEATSAALEAVRDAARSKTYDEIMHNGSAWVLVKPNHKSNTRLGKEERIVLKGMGFRWHCSNKAYELWNPAGYAGRSLILKLAGAVAYADVLKAYGFKAYYGSMAD